MRDLDGASSEGIASAVAGGAANQVLVQNATDSTTFIPNGSVGQVLTATAGLPTFQNATITDFGGGSAGKVLYQDAPSSTTFTNAVAGAMVSTGTLPNFVNGSEGQVLTSHTAGQPTFMTPAFTNPLLVPLTVNSSTIGSSFASASGTALVVSSSGVNEEAARLIGALYQESRLGSTRFNATFSNTDSSEARVYLANNVGGLSMLVTNAGETKIVAGNDLVLDNNSGSKLTITNAGMTNSAYTTGGTLINNTSGVISSITGAEGKVLTSHTSGPPTFETPTFTNPLLVPLVVNSSTTGSTFTSASGTTLVVSSSGVNEEAARLVGPLYQESRAGSTRFNATFSNTDSSEARVYLANNVGGISMLVTNTGATKIVSGNDLVLDNNSGSKLTITASGMNNNAYSVAGALVNNGSGDFVSSTGLAGMKLSSNGFSVPSFSFTTPVNVKTFLVAGAFTYTPSSSLVNYILIKAAGGGGGGGGGNTNTGSGITGKVGGGGSGGAVVELYTTAGGFTGTIGVGGGGGAGAANAAASNGSDGGATTIPSKSIVATAGLGGGGAGQGGNISDNGAAGFSVTGSGGQINIPSQGGGVGHDKLGAYGGGNSIVPATRQQRMGAIAVLINGINGVAGGGGGAAGGMYGGAGGTGAIGAVYVYEFF